MLASGNHPVVVGSRAASASLLRPPSLVQGGRSAPVAALCDHRRGRRRSLVTVAAAAAGGNDDAATTTTTAADNTAPSKTRTPGGQPSSWTAKDARSAGNPDADDYLRALGTQSYTNTNVTTGQNVGMIDSLFTGKTLGHQTDIADGSLRKYEARTFANLVGDYYVAPRFMDRIASHIAKNYLADMGALGNAGKRVPLILGVWGGKGSGKTFQTELALKKLKAEPIIMSAGELESDKAGEPGRLLRERYRRASELSKVRGVLSALVINDLDAGIGIFKETQRTVNNQMVGGTLMSICDSPNRVAVYGESWEGEVSLCRRIPIIVTGNDLSTLFAPLIRDGRMDKFHYEPSREDKIAIVSALYRDDGLPTEDAARLVDAFSRQSLDFFGAIRAATYDGQIREWLQDIAGGELATEKADTMRIHTALLKKQGLPTFEPVTARLDDLLREGRRLVAEQELVKQNRLSEEYLKTLAGEARAKREGTWRVAANGVGLKG
jgi:hypothetical protein